MAKKKVVSAKDQIRQLFLNDDRLYVWKGAQDRQEVEERLEKVFLNALHILGYNSNNENFTKTPMRIARAWVEMLRGDWDTIDEVDRLLSVTFPSDQHDEMVVVSDMDAIGLCPHHFLPIEYRVTVGYLPKGPEFRVVGLSKIPRLVEVLAARAVMQETLSAHIVGCLMAYLNPMGAGVLVVGRHGCLSCRGAKQRSAIMRTTWLSGVFRDDPSIKQEFFMHATSNGTTTK